MNWINRFLIVFICLFSSLLFSQQITIDNTVSPQNLVENTLIQGCVDVNNISSPNNGNSVGIGSYGYFERGESNFPFANGIVLSTGNANSGGNTQNNTTLNDGNSSWTTDTDLETALGISNTLNATSIEFNFTSISNTIQFNYILASEEYYGNFPCQYSDGFAFLIREAGSGNPYTNIAIVPGTATPVNTNTVHDEIVGFCDASNEEFFGGYNVGDTNYNGRTAVLSATATIQPNVQYQIKLVIADQTDENYDSAVFIEGNSFNAAVDLGEDVTTCATNVLLDGNIENPQATYSWYLDNNLIAGAVQTTLDVTQSGNYRVEISIPLSGENCTIEDEVTITLSSTQTSEPVSDYQICDDTSNDGVETFDLNTKNAEVLASVPSSNYTISYHFTSSDAQNGLNPILTPIQNTSNPQTTFVRIEDIDNGCLAFSTFDLVVNSLPSIVNPTPLEVCDDATADGYTTIDLSVKDNEITNGQPNLVVTYHATSIDAASGSNPLPMPYVNSSANEQVYVSVQNPQSGCISTTTLDIVVLENPVINTARHYIDACDEDHNGFAEFDLTSIIDDVLQGLTDVNISFHETYEDAVNGANPIANESNYQNSESELQNVFIRVENDSTGCASVTTIELHTNLLLTGTNINNISSCDVDNDNSEDFNLESIATGIINDLENVTVDFYETEADRDAQTNALDQSVTYTPQNNPQILYLYLASDTCNDVAEIEIILTSVDEFEPIADQTVCDEDQDGLTTTDLSQFDDEVTDSMSGFTVSYFLTEEDAEANENVLSNFYTNNTNPFTLFTRIQSNGTGCFDVNAFNITVLEAPVTSAPSPLIICDDDQDGYSIVNLSHAIPQVVTDTNERIISFHNSQTDADSNTNAITENNSYNAQTELIYIRVENTVTGCHSTETYSIIVNVLPVFQPIENYKICEDNSDDFADFIFNTKDAEILNGQPGKAVLYFRSQSDAENRINAIDKNNAYQNVSNPQTIYVRVENLTDQNCFGTSNFIIEVGTNPEYNQPSNWFVCDDASNDGFESFDLTTKAAEISQGISDNLSITFYTSAYNAENSISPLPDNFTNTVNPQQIYVQIDNGTICNSITSFMLNVIQVPEVNEAQPMVQCDTDYDGFVAFDLTQAEVDILDVRQDDIEINYFESMANVESHTNAISNPEDYINVSNPQTVFVKITNTISNCYVTVPIELSVNLPPPIQNFGEYQICENATNSFDLNEINDALMEESFNVLISYYSNETDAYTNTNSLDTNYTYQTTNDTLFARIEYSTTHCFYIYEFNLRVNPLPVANLPNGLMACDDDFDGILEFDLSTQDASVLGNQNPAQYHVSYYNSVLQAEEGTEPLETNYMAFDSEMIYARIENNSTGCYDVTQFEVTINPLPVININDQVICLDDLPLIVSANTNNTTDQYLWSTGETSAEITITQVGVYWVTVTSDFGCENTRTFSVSESEAATIEFTETIDFSDPNNITISVSGIGDYLYQLDNGEPQESPFFENVSLGYHTITVIDINGCSEVTEEVIVIDAPKHMTPNGDGDFDTWHISGVETLPGTVIYIYDRYGKLLKQLSATTAGWDGTYNGNKMPASDYWFLAKVQKDNESFEVKGHFTLRR
ncbi:MAG: T9SS type B sorting domain-containing protein [Winogradskyella sp.]|uniref:T9SS type B sorting domain-containing protein n=1 Tax=Winogradskyella sp. TaxID=1883156 RepID=UPI0018575853|nr:T9SS type B sorting domain-containing protein [Winogradskyella sp.]